MIDTNLSERYGLCTYGPHGVEILSGDRQVKKFTDGKTVEENWQAALEYAREQEQQEAQQVTA